MTGSWLIAGTLGLVAVAAYKFGVDDLRTIAMLFPMALLVAVVSSIVVSRVDS